MLHVEKLESSLSLLESVYELVLLDDVAINEVAGSESGSEWNHLRCCRFCVGLLMCSLWGFGTFY